jgi:diacylglycerol kinase (ATP)
MEVKERKYLFVVNPIAGGKEKAKLPAQINNFCNAAQCNYRLFHTTGKDDLVKIKQIYDGFSPDAVIAIGGDGTVNLVGNLLLHTGVPLGIIPLGSGNGLAKDLGLPINIVKAFDVIHRFEYKYIDILSFNGDFCFHLCDLGFNARVVHKFANSSIRGKFSYFWYGLKEFVTYKSFPYKIKSRIENYEGHAFMMIVSNANKFGTNVSINPLGEIDDGWFEVSIIKPFSKWVIPYVFYHLMRDTIYSTPYYKIIRSRKVIIDNINSELSHIDGEPIESSENIIVEIVPHALKVLM